MGALFSFLLVHACTCLCGFGTVRFWPLSHLYVALDYLFAGQKPSCRAFVADLKLLVSRHPSPHEDVLKRWHLF